MKSRKSSKESEKNRMKYDRDIFEKINRIIVSVVYVN